MLFRTTLQGDEFFAGGELPQADSRRTGRQRPKRLSIVAELEAGTRRCCEKRSPRLRIPKAQPVIPAIGGQARALAAVGDSCQAILVGLKLQELPAALHVPDG